MDLKAGQWVIDYNFRGFSQLSEPQGITDVVDGKVVTYYRNVISLEGNTRAPSDLLTVEYAVLDGWSLGIKNQNATVSGLIHAVRDSILQVDLAIFSNLRLTDQLGLQGSGWEAFWYQEVQLTPVWSNTASVEGLLNVYSGISVAARLYDSDGVKLSAYLDPKITSSFPSPLTLDQWTNRDLPKSYLDANGIAYASDFVVKAVPSTSAFVALGLEVNLGTGFNASLGSNIPLGTLVTTGKDALSWNMNGFQNWVLLKDYEFQLKWVL
jgi:hypothetical protein